MVIYYNMSVKELYDHIMYWSLEFWIPAPNNFYLNVSRLKELQSHQMKIIV